MAEGSVLGPTKGTAVWCAGALMMVKASEEQTAAAFSLLDQTAPVGYAQLRHDQTLSAGAWSFVFLPKNVPHTFKVRGESGPGSSR